ncbi:MAG: class I adenylate-forming enzyme family protein [Chitinophagales bacterium]|nr:acyl--CoA ligase [Bacteroidota bacterium]MBK8487902.1 acyl--CoA ligase [Bacteroidota bacterium]MBK8682344.1 acyl--CoA ligase [Bacteroidota bacterium]
MNVSNYLREKAKSFPDNVFINDLEKDFTFSEIENLANCFANFLRRKNINKGDRVVLQLYNSIDFVIIYNAIIRLGAIVVPIGVTLTSREINAILNDCDPQLFIRHKALHAQQEIEFNNETIVLDEMEMCTSRSFIISKQFSQTFDIVDLYADDPLGILYTSGTTGQAKGILLSHGNIETNMKAAQECYQSNIHDSTILFLPFSHCFGLNAILNCMTYSGTSIVIMRRFNLNQLYQILHDKNITLFFAVPFVYNLLLKNLSDDTLFDRTAYFFSAASKLALETEKSWLTRFARPIFQGYGLTETSPFATYVPRHNYMQGSVGIPVNNVEIKIVDDKRITVQENTIGEIAIKGPNIMLGYFNQPTLTNSVKEDGWFYSGDVGFLNNENHLFIVDRIKDMIIVKGENVYPSEVENVILELPIIEEVAVYGIMDDHHEEVVKARIVLKADVNNQEEFILQHCKKNLANFKVPQHISFVESLQKSPSGKILKKLMREEDLLQSQS